ncbi:unnamed protein product [Rotaria sordida]|uniref:Uncharacterized protein n=1 Tax=Rotaria sordida TaxID=392033 RepID=A0A814V1C8_9BILA|nr:unnamed protein product [Rotaria sordida]CAF3928874.1 unnamed protein product [Rotaria sordida]CAF4056624.1 unnamed protein product [Rotaria sordida]
MEQPQQQQQQTKEKGEANTNVRNLRNRTISLVTPKHRESLTSIPLAKILCRRHTVSSTSSSKCQIDLLIPQALPPQKKRSRLAVLGLINIKGYHFPSVDIWVCTEEHHMDSTHFLSWLDSTCVTL